MELRRNCLDLSGKVGLEGVKDGGVSVLPRCMVTTTPRAGNFSMHRLPKELATVQTLFIRRQDAYVSSAMTALLKIIGAFHAGSKSADVVVI